MDDEEKEAIKILEGQLAQVSQIKRRGQATPSA